MAANLVEIACSRGPVAVSQPTRLLIAWKANVHQLIDVVDITQQLRDKSDEELKFYLEYGGWREDSQPNNAPSDKEVASAISATRTELGSRDSTRSREAKIRKSRKASPFLTYAPARFISDKRLSPGAPGHLRDIDTA